MVTFNSTDLDNATSESGVVHESVANTDHDNASNLKQGYSIANPYLSTDLVGYWPLQEDSGTTAYDFSGNANHGTTNGGVTVNQPGLLGTSAYSFDGVDDEVVINAGTISQPATLTAYVNLDSLASTNGENALQLLSDGNYTLRLDQYDNTEQYGFTHHGTADYTFSTPTIVGEFTFLVWVMDTNEARFYLNGSYEDTNTNTIPIPTGTITSRGPFTATNIRIYNRALTASEIQTLYDVVASSGTLTTPYKTV